LKESTVTCNNLPGLHRLARLLRSLTERTQEIARGPASGASERDWRAAPLDEIVKHIAGTHHEYLKLEPLHGASIPGRLFTYPALVTNLLSITNS
jgi:hypothetical protein